MIVEFTNGVVFSSSFCSGNMQNVVNGDRNEYIVSTAADCAGTEFETTYSTWFYFSVKGLKADETIHIRVENLNQQSKMFGHDMRPVFRSLPSSPEWERLKEAVQYGSETIEGNEKKNFWIRFRYRCLAEGDEAFFAFTYPYSFEDCMGTIDWLKGYCEMKKDIYFHRNLLTRSLEGRRVDLLTISGKEGISDEVERFVTEKEGTFPDPEEPLPRKFSNKPVFFMSARVHPGETAANWMWDGFVRFLVSDDLRAQILRKMFVFKMVPIINPDGVARGHYRADTRGVNLNRYYDMPSMSLHPTIFAIKGLLTHIRATSELAIYIDLHAHATKRGCFAFGNCLDRYEDQIENLLFPRILSINSAYFDFNASNFASANMTARDKKGESKEGSGRVGIYRITGIARCYTIECNYNDGRWASLRPQSIDESGRASPVEKLSGLSPKFTHHIFRSIGKAIAISFLDVHEANPFSRIPNSKPNSIAGIKESLKSRLIATAPYRQQILDERKTEQQATQAEAAETKKTGRQSKKPSSTSWTIPTTPTNGNSNSTTITTTTSSSSAAAAAAISNNNSNSSSGGSGSGSGIKQRSVRGSHPPHKTKHPQPPPPPPTIIVDDASCSDASCSTANSTASSRSQKSGLPPCVVAVGPFISSASSTPTTAASNPSSTTSTPKSLMSTTVLTPSFPAPARGHTGSMSSRNLGSNSSFPASSIPTLNRRIHSQPNLARVRNGSDNHNKPSN